ncbi:MAG: polysaccharide deacetylase family protein [Chitinispirillales bacterium]|jgi:peptidoglycan/xylan/chitin deacetylase (PgdA/CDA1 family)|nr:polysaccharide deacetylase family protein [Chitinispirillales bacterium]
MNPMTALTAAATLATAPLLAGAAAAALTPLLQRRRVPLPSPSVTGLLIHSVYDKPQLNLSGISKNTFGEILDCLKNNNINMITVSQHTAPRSLSRGDSAGIIDTDTPIQITSTLPKTAITFDDGLSSFYDNAYPMLEERGIKSTLFPVAGLIGKRGDWDVIGRPRHITAAMLREIADSGHEIGSHSLTHANLVWLNDDELIKELRDSKSILEDIAGTAVKSLSFPFGSWNKRVWNAAKSAGYENATAYRGHRSAPPEFMPVFGVYRFDSATDAVSRAIDVGTLQQAAITPAAASPSLIPPLSIQSATSKAFASLMSHFCKGTPLVKFRKTYRLFPQPSPPALTSSERS